MTYELHKSKLNDIKTDLKTGKGYTENFKNYFDYLFEVIDELNERMKVLEEKCR